MKKLNFTRKGKIITGIVCVIVLAVVAVVGINMYRVYETKKQISTHQEQIAQAHESFSNAKDHNEKLDTLKSIQKEYEQYENTGGKIVEINRKYEKELKTMKRYFTGEYEKIISENTLEKIEEIMDKSKLTTTKTNLEAVLKSITDEKGVVCTDKEAKNYSESINKIIISYDTRIKAIEQKEAEEAAAKKAAEEAAAKKAAEEAAAKREAEEAAAQEAQASSSNNSGSNYYEGSSSSSDYSNSGSGNDYYDSGSSNSGSGSSDSSSGNGWHVYDSEGNDITDHEPGGYDPNDPVWY